MNVLPGASPLAVSVPMSGLADIPGLRAEYGRQLTISTDRREATNVDQGLLYQFARQVSSG